MTEPIIWDLAAKIAQLYDYRVGFFPGGPLQVASMVVEGNCLGALRRVTDG